MIAISPQWPSLDVTTADVVITGRVIPMGSMRETRLHPTSLLLLTQCFPDIPQSNRNPKQNGGTRRVPERPEQPVYMYVTRVEQASFNLLVGLGEISGGFNSSQPCSGLLASTKESDQC